MISDSRKVSIILGPIPQEGGVTTFIEEFTDILQQKGYFICIVTLTNPKNSSNFLSRLTSDSVITLFLPKDIYTFIKFLYKNKIDITISNVYYSLIIPLIHSTRKIHILHGFGNLEASLLQFIIGNLSNIIGYRCTQTSIANSYLTASINRIFGVKNSAVVPWGIPRAFQQPIIKDFSQRDIDLLYVGRICLTKGLMLILNALARIHNKGGQQINFHLIGALKDNLQSHQKLQEKSLDNIIYHGYLDKEKIVEMYSRSKLFISLNPEEPFGFTYVEALACGTPIIIPKSCGIAPFVDSRLALFVDMNEHSIAEAIEHGLSKFWNLDEIASLSRDTFCWQKVANVIFGE